MTDSIGALIIDVAGTDLTSEERELIAHPLVGGIIFFARNYDSRKQLTNLCHEIRRSRGTPLLVMVDQEGGRVQRFIKEFTRLPNMYTFGEMYSDSAKNACEAAKECAWLMASEILSTGIDLSLAPVLDLNKGISSIIGTRAFHPDPEVVIQLAQSFVQGLQEAGMAATGKHFPGHGSVMLDSHLAIPIDERSMNEIEREDLVPFTGLVKSGISAVMAAHIIFPKIDKLAVGFSRFWLQDVLRKKMGFTGTIFSDDLNMEGANISSNYGDRVLAAREAGCDFALLCNNRRGVIQVLDALPYQANQVSPDKWSVLKGNFSRVKVPLEDDARWQHARKLLQSLTQDQVQI